MQFLYKGIYGDEEMPQIDEFRTTIMGLRESPLFDVSAALDEIGTIRSGRISWYARPIEGTDIEVLSSMDEGSSWDRMINNEFLQNVEQLNDNPFIKLKYVIRSTVAELFPEKSPRLFSVTLTLSNQLQESWSKEFKHQLEWEGGSD